MSSMSQSKSNAFEVDDLPFKCTVVITHYEQQKFLQQAINSASNQGYKNKEIIIVDDASPNGLPADLKLPECAKLIVREKNGGTAAARNTGVMASSKDSQFIAFLDADDFYLEDKIAVSIGKLSEYPGIGVAYTEYFMLKESTGETTREFKEPFSFESLCERCTVSTNSVVRKAVFEKVGMFDESIRGMEDYNFWLRASLKFMFVHIPFPMFTYRSHGGNKTEVTPIKDWLEEETAMKKAFFKSIGITK